MSGVDPHEVKFVWGYNGKKDNPCLLHQIGYIAVSDKQFGTIVKGCPRGGGGITRYNIIIIICGG